jgi:hypothetical protein
MGYNYVKRPKPSVGGSAKIQGKTGLHLIISTKDNGAIMVACSPRWFSATSSRMAEDHYNCAKCLLSFGEGGEA